MRVLTVNLDGSLLTRALVVKQGVSLSSRFAVYWGVNA